MNKEWYEQSKKNHEEFLKRAQAKGRLATEDEIQRFLVLAAVCEAGELANLYKKEWRGDDVNASEFAEKIHGEIADVYIYLMHLCSHLKVDIETLAANKVAIVKNHLNH